GRACEGRGGDRDGGGEPAMHASLPPYFRWAASGYSNLLLRVVQPDVWENFSAGARWVRSLACYSHPPKVQSRRGAAGRASIMQNRRTIQAAFTAILLAAGAAVVAAPPPRAEVAVI